MSFLPDFASPRRLISKPLIVCLEKEEQAQQLNIKKKDEKKKKNERSKRWKPNKKCRRFFGGHYSNLNGRPKYFQRTGLAAFDGDLDNEPTKARTRKKSKNDNNSNNNSQTKRNNRQKFYA